VKRHHSSDRSGPVPRASAHPPCRRRTMTLALATLALGMILFALFFALIEACDRI
jgi:hypothetical protein